jgi:nucleoside-diphosphate-sugar epimerase
VVFASSNFVVVGRRFGRGAQTTTMEPAPINPYGASKLFSERVGTMFAERYGVSCIAFRIGVCQRTNDNLHRPWIPFGRWGQAMWVSDRDLCRAFEHAIDDERIGFGVFATSRASPIRASSWRIWAWRRPSSPERDTAPRRYYQGWQRCGTTNAHRGCLELSVPGAD